MNTQRLHFHSLILLTSGLVFSLAGPAGGQTPSFTIGGRVVEADRLNSISGATVRLSGRPVFFTDSNGEFRLNGVPPGPHTLTVEGMGYRTHQSNLVVSADKVLSVELEVDPIRLDSLLVEEAGTFTLRGCLQVPSLSNLTQLRGRHDVDL